MTVVEVLMRLRFNDETRRNLYLMLAKYPRLTAVLRARNYDKLEFVRQWLGLRNERAFLRQMRNGRDVCWIEDEADLNPLVTIAIPTFRRPKEVVRAVYSALNQTYHNLEVLVIGDHTNLETKTALASISDPRLRFINLRHQGIYPKDNARLRGFVSGTKPMNVGIDLAAGAWLTGCDDDDELLENHVETLLGEAKRRRLELVYSQFEVIDHPPPDSPDSTLPKVSICGSEPMRIGSIARGAVLYSMGLHFMRYETDCWRIRDPHDWNLWKRMKLVGVRIGFKPEVTYRYHRFQTSDNSAKG